MIFVCPGRRGGGDDSGGDYCLSCVDQIISVIRLYVLVIAFSPHPPTLPLFVKHTPSGTAERQGNPSHPVWERAERSTRTDPITSS